MDTYEIISQLNESMDCLNKALSEVREKGGGEAPKGMKMLDRAIVLAIQKVHKALQRA